LNHILKAIRYKSLFIGFSICMLFPITKNWACSKSEYFDWLIKMSLLILSPIIQFRWPINGKPPMWWNSTKEQEVQWWGDSGIHLIIMSKSGFCLVRLVTRLARFWGTIPQGKVEKVLCHTTTPHFVSLLFQNYNVKWVPFLIFVLNWYQFKVLFQKGPNKRKHY